MFSLYIIYNACINYSTLFHRIIAQWLITILSTKINAKPQLKWDLTQHKFEAGVMSGPGDISAKYVIQIQIDFKYLTKFCHMYEPTIIAHLKLFKPWIFQIVVKYDWSIWKQISIYIFVKDTFQVQLLLLINIEDFGLPKIDCFIKYIIKIIIIWISNYIDLSLSYVCFIISF